MKTLKIRSILALTVMICLATFCSADSVFGTLNFIGIPDNDFDPFYGFGVTGTDNLNLWSPTIGIPGTFGFSDGEIVATAQFTGTQLIVTDTCMDFSDCNLDGGWEMTFTDPNFTGLSMVSNSLGVTYSFNNGTITLDFDEGDIQPVKSAVFNVTETPEPGSLALLGSGLLGLGGAVRRKQISS